MILTYMHDMLNYGLFRDAYTQDGVLNNYCMFIICC